MTTPAMSIGGPGRGRQRAWWLAVIAAVACGAVAGALPLLLGAPNGDDAYYHAMRAQQQARCWLGGVVLPRWYPDLNGGLGGPEPRAYPLVPLVAHAALATVGNDAVWATGAATLLIPVLAGLAMLWAARRRGSAPGVAAVTACVWAAAPYLLVAVHDRGAFAEGWGLALLPLVLDALLPPRPRSAPELLRASALFALLLATQLPLALMTVLIVAVWQLVTGRAAGALPAFAAGGGGLALAAVSWLPNVAALWRLQGDKLTGGVYGWRQHMLPGGLAGDPRLAIQLSAVLASVVAAAIIVFFFTGRGEARSWAGAALAAAALATPLAFPLYALVPGLDMLQFPWRWLGPATCLLILGTAHLSQRRAPAAVRMLLLLPLLILPGLRWRLPPGPAMRPSETAQKTARAATRYGVPPILPSLPAYLPRDTDLREALVAAPVARRRLAATGTSGPRSWSWIVTCTEPETVELPVLPDSGWRVSVDGRRASWRAVHGLVAIDVVAGRHRVDAVQVWLWEDVAGAAITAASLLALAVLACLQRRRTAGGG